jgi:hypothetical protein
MSRRKPLAVAGSANTKTTKLRKEIENAQGKDVKKQKTKKSTKTGKKNTKAAQGKEEEKEKDEEATRKGAKR